jgi:hypothetical protein
MPSSIVSITTVPPVCNGGVGCITVVVSGTYPYAFYLDGGSVRNVELDPTTYKICNIVPGSHELYIEDGDNNVSDTETFIMTQPDPVSFTVTNFSNVSCFGAADGQFTLTGTGGNGIFSYSINGGQSFSNKTVFEDLDPGSYSIVVVDSNGCIGRGTITITTPTEIECDLQVVNPTVPGGNDGFIIATISGGTYPMELTWDDGAYYDLLAPGSILHNNLTAGDYVLNIYDYNKCYHQCDAQLVDPSITIPPTPQNPDQDIINASVISNCCLGDEIYNVFKQYNNGHVDIKCLAIPAMLLAKKIDLFESYYTPGQEIGGKMGYFVFTINSFFNTSVSVSFEGMNVTYVGDNGLSYDDNATALLLLLLAEGYEAEYDSSTRYMWIYSPMNCCYNGQSPIVTARDKNPPFSPRYVNILTNNGFMGAESVCNTDDLLVCITSDQKDELLEQIRQECKTCICGELTSNDIN